MICVFSPTDRDFSSNGDKLLHPSRAKVYKTDNGDYYLDIEVRADEIKWLKQDYIIAVDTPFGRQGFRVSNVDKKFSKGTAKAWHLYYDTSNYIVMDTRPENTTCDNALKKLALGSDMPQNCFSFSSDVKGNNTYYCVRTSLKEAMQTVLDRWGGHLVRDNFDIRIKNSIGVDNGITLSYGKNISDIQVTEKWDNVVTKIYPVGKDGFLLSKLSIGGGKYYNPYIVSDVSYDKPYTKVVSFTQEINAEDYETEEAYFHALWSDLYSQAKEYLNTHSIPEITYVIKSTTLKITDIGDIIEVYYKPLDINLETSVTSLVYDAIQERFTEVTFGNYKRKLSDFKQTILSTAETTATTKAVAVATAAVSTKADKSEVTKIADTVNNINSFESLTKSEIDTLTT